MSVNEKNRAFSRYKQLRDQSAKRQRDFVFGRYRDQRKKDFV